MSINIPVIDENLRLNTGETLTSTGGPTGGNFVTVDLGANWAERGNIRAYLKITSLDNTTTDETYVALVESGNDASITNVAGDAEVVIDKAKYLNGGLLDFVFTPFDQFIGLTLTLGGTTPSIVIEVAGLIDDGANS